MQHYCVVMFYTSLQPFLGKVHPLRLTTMFKLYCFATVIVLKKNTLRTYSVCALSWEAGMKFYTDNTTGALLDYL